MIDRADPADAAAIAPRIDLADWWDDPAWRAALAVPLGMTALAWPGLGTVYQRRRFGLAQLELAPLGLYAPVSVSQRASGRAPDSAPASARLEDFIDRAPRQAARVTLNLDPLDPRRDALAARAAAAGWQVLPRSTHLLALDGAPEALRRGYHATKRAQVRRAPALPCRVECVRGPGRLDDYWPLYEAAAARWGRAGPPYPRALFEALLASPAVELWLMHVAGRPACGAVVFVGRRAALYWQGAARIDEHTRGTFPMLRLMDALIASLAARGVPWLNLGASEGLPSVARFKEELGARAVAYPTLRRESVAWRALAALAGLRGLRGLTGLTGLTGLGTLRRAARPGAEAPGTPAPG
jgi:hypothetical protein